MAEVFASCRQNKEMMVAEHSRYSGMVQCSPIFVLNVAGKLSQQRLAPSPVDLITLRDRTKEVEFDFSSELPQKFKQKVEVLHLTHSRDKREFHRPCLLFCLRSLRGHSIGDFVSHANGIRVQPTRRRCTQYVGLLARGRHLPQ